MDTFSASELKRLTGTRQGPCISVFMPTHAAGPDGQQDALRLKNLLTQAERGLVGQGMRVSAARQLLRPVRNLPNELVFWDKRGQGLALFVAEGVFHRFRTPMLLNESVVVGQRFQIKPLLPLLNADDRFYVLAVSQNRVRFFEGSRAQLCERQVPGMPENIDKALNYDRAQRGMQIHSGQRGHELGKQGAVFRSHSAEREVGKEDLVQYFRIIQGVLRPVVRDSRTPLILAGVQYLLAIYREVAAYPHLAKEELPGNPDHLSEQTLHAQAWPMVEAWQQQRRAEAVAKYRQLAGTGKTLDNLNQILPSACQGQIEVLFVDCNAHCWGTYDPQTGDIDLTATNGNADDLLDYAAVQTLLNRGVVHAVAASECPSPPICAVLRY